MRLVIATVFHDHVHIVEVRVSKLRPPKGLLLIPPMIDENGATVE
jgi:hypothetical protein